MHESYNVEHRAERRLWALLGLLSRVYSLPEREYEQWRNPGRKRHLISSAKAALSLIRKLYGDYHCTYNVHQLLHLEEIRQKGPFPLSSAFSTEGYYSKIRKAVQHKPSKHIGKQILQSTYTEYCLPHRCQRRMTFDPHESKKTSNSFCYRYIPEDQEYVFYKVVSAEENHLKVKKVVTANIEASHQQSLSSLEFSRAGVKQYVASLQEEFIVPICVIDGKAIRIGKYIASVSKITLFEAN